MRQKIVYGLIGILLSGAAWADFEAGMQAFDRRDYRTAVQELQPLANAGDPYAQYMLGRLYLVGNGVLQDYVEAHKWFNLAAAGGHGYAAQAREATASRMNANQIGRAQRLAREWRPGSAQDTSSNRSQDKPELIRGIQDGLNALGYDAGPVDGAMGRRTRIAIMDYQANAGLVETGEPTEKLLQHIRDSIKTAKANDDRQGDDREDNRRWSKLIVSDKFSDGNFSRNPRWTVATGNFSVDRNYGLRSVVDLYRSFNRSGSNSVEELGVAILQSIIEQAAGIERSSSSAEASEIFLAAQIDNAFAIELTLNARDTQGPLVFGVYQGRSRNSGYRLIITPEGQLVMASLSRQGSEIIASSNHSIDLSDGQQHSLRWVRRPNGRMTVHIDKREYIRARDRLFQDDFGGFVWINQGGDYGLRQIHIFGRG